MAPSETGSTCKPDCCVKRFDNVDEAFQRLDGAESKSLLKRHLTKAVYEELKDEKTKTFGSGLLDVIQSGCANLDSGVGIYAPDAESYDVFAPLFDPVIREYHKIDGEISHPPFNFGTFESISDIDPENKYVISTRCRVARSIAKFPLGPSMKKEDYLEMEKMVKNVVEKFEGELAGKYHSLSTMDEALKKQLIAEHYLFKEGDRFLEAANTLRFWPDGRGIFINNDKTFLIWVGEEDHLRIISMQKGGDLAKVCKRLDFALAEFSKNFEFMHSDRLGFLTLCPTNLGSTIRASVHIKLPKLSKDMQRMEQLAADLNLQIRGIHGEHSESEGGVYDISNKRRLGFTEECLISDMFNGCKKLIEVEESL